MTTMNLFRLHVVVLICLTDSIRISSNSKAHNVNAFAPSKNNIHQPVLPRPSVTSSSLLSISTTHHEEVENEANTKSINPNYDFELLKLTLNPNQQKCLDEALKEHNEQYQSGITTFGCSTYDSSPSSDHNNEPNATKIMWKNDDFNEYFVQKGHAGPNELVLQNGNIIYESKRCILSNEECDDFINVAKYTIQKEKKEQEESRNDNNEEMKNINVHNRERSNADLGEARLSHLPKDALNKIRTMLETQLYPLLESRYGMKDLTVYDGLILGHLAPTRSQPVHRDASLLTLNIPLSTLVEDFNGGGGTYIEGLVDHNRNGAIPICIEKGKVICHSSGILHAGCGIHHGERWVLVLFVIAKNEPQIARRCHSKGLYAISDGNLDEAMNQFQTGLSFAPEDHLLHMGMGQIASIQADNDNLDNNTRKAMYQESMNCLALAARTYPPSLKANIALGKMFLIRKRPRAALRRFDAVLDVLDNKDLADGAFLALKAQGWDTRVSAVRAALICAEWVVNNKKKNSDSVFKDMKKKWSNQIKIQEAIERLQISMIALPEDEQLLSLMERARKLSQLSPN